jgi:ABC-type dipeptide/oligopeptide/nickel transport system permease subunit
LVPGLFAVGIAIFGPFVAPHDIAQPIGFPWSPPTTGAPLGTDYLGRDVLSRVLSGGRTVVLLPLVATAISVALGAIIGILAGSIHNRIDGLLMRSMDVILSVPAILILVVLVTGFGGGPASLVAVVMLVATPFTARLARSLAIDISRTGYVESAFGRGETTIAVLLREITPNVAGPLLADAGLVYTGSIFVVAFASFLGFGVQPPTADWALMAAENNPGIEFNVWSVLVPLLLIVSLTISSNLLADRVARRLAAVDPRTAAR